MQTPRPPKPLTPDRPARIQSLYRLSYPAPPFLLDKMQKTLAHLKVVNRVGCKFEPSYPKMTRSLVRGLSFIKLSENCDIRRGSILPVGSIGVQNESDHNVVLRKS
jgi:hypothetical protein